MDKTTPHRQYNMDLLRCILILMVIVLHYNNRGMGGALNYGMQGNSTEFFVRFMESLCIPAVDVFLMISGFFASYRKSVPYHKAIWLLAVCSFYRTIAYILHAVLVIHEFSFRTLISNMIPANWFVCLFVTVLLLSPYIDRLMDKLDEHAMDELMCILMGLFVVVPSAVSVVGDIAGVDLSGIATITVLGDAEGFSIVTFIVCYFCGVYVRAKEKVWDRFPACFYLLIYLVCAAMSTALSYRTETVWSYASIFTTIEAISLVILFSKIKIEKPYIGRVLSGIGGCSLGIFIWHTTPLMLYGFWVHFNIDAISEMRIGGAIMNLLAACLAMYVVAGVWVYVCRVIVKTIKKRRNGY